MTILGIDVGYSHTKLTGKNKEFNFKSTVEEGILDVSSAIKVEYEGFEYTIGEQNGLYATDLNKIDSLNFNLCLFTAIAKAMENKTTSDIQLVTGLPAQYYQSQKDELINKLKNKKVTITLGEEPKRFTITDVIVFPQSAGVLVLNPELLVGDVCVIDIGGFTVDISCFNGKRLVKLYTLELGMNILANTLVQKIKSEYGVSYDVLKADDILNSGEIVVDGKEVDISSLIYRVKQQHTEKIINRLKGLDEYNFSKRIFVGGGSLRLKDYLKHEVSDQSYYVNSRAYYRIGVEKFGKQDEETN